MKELRSLKSWRIRRLRNLRTKLQELLEEASLAVLYELYETINNEVLRKKIERRILEMAVGDDDLLEIALNEAEPLRGKAWEKLTSRIQNGHIKKSRAREILKNIIKHVAELREDAWKLFKTLEPGDEELKEIQGFDFTYSAPSIIHDIEQLIRKRHGKKDSTAKIVEKIQDTIKKINKLKKG